MKYYGGCDVGSTYTKAVILDENGKICADTTIRSKINSEVSAKLAMEEVLTKVGLKSSEELGTIVQKTIIDEIADGNSRVAKKITNDVYLLKGVKSTAIIVECGFLSNPTDAALLSDPEYCKELAFCIYSGVIDALSQTQATPQ